MRQTHAHTRNRVFAVFPFHQSICASMLHKSADDLKNIWQQWNTAEYIYLKLQPQLHTLSICSNFCFRKPFYSLLIYFLLINEVLTDKTDKNIQIHHNIPKPSDHGNFHRLIICNKIRYSIMVGVVLF